MIPCVPSATPIAKAGGPKGLSPTGRTDATLRLTTQWFVSQIREHHHDAVNEILRL
jgi:hypothetical protein